MGSRGVPAVSKFEGHHRASAPRGTRSSPAVIVLRRERRRAQFADLPAQVRCRVRPLRTTDATLSLDCLSTDEAGRPPRP